MSKIFNTLMTIVTKTTVSTGASIGHGHSPEGLPLGGSVNV